MADPQKPNNPWAFPRESEYREYQASDMTLRDYAAIKAMAAYLVAPPLTDDAVQHPDRVAEWSYQQADAMLKEREKDV